jgi:YD repeat-containing protein
VIRNVSTAPTPRIVSACPALATPAPWTAELFPDCAPPPFATPFPVCVGEACPTPCRAIGSRGDDDLVYQFSYDARQRWLSTRYQSTVWQSCEYAGERVATCTNNGETFTFARGPRGEIVEANGSEGNHLRYRYANDDLVEISVWDTLGKRWYPGSTFRYVNHRLVAQEQGGHELAYRYDGPRLVEREVRYAEQLATMRFAYDAHGRLTAIESTPKADDTSMAYRIVFAYDGDRIARVSRTDHEQRIETTTFEYDCR